MILNLRGPYRKSLINKSVVESTWEPKIVKVTLL